jgi:hypothetical protein
MMHTESCEVLTTLFHLSKRIRQSAQPSKMKFISTNETHNLLPYFHNKLQNKEIQE